MKKITETVTAWVDNLDATEWVSGHYFQEFNNPNLPRRKALLSMMDRARLPRPEAETLDSWMALWN